MYESNELASVEKLTRELLPDIFEYIGRKGELLLGRDAEFLSFIGEKYMLGEREISLFSPPWLVIGCQMVGSSKSEWRIAELRTVLNASRKKRIKQKIVEEIRQQWGTVSVNYCKMWHNNSRDDNTEKYGMLTRWCNLTIVDAADFCTTDGHILSTLRQHLVLIVITIR